MSMTLICWSETPSGFMLFSTVANSARVISVALVGAADCAATNDGIATTRQTKVNETTRMKASSSSAFATTAHDTARVAGGWLCCGHLGRRRFPQPFPHLPRTWWQRIAREQIQHNGRQHDEGVTQEHDAQTKIDVDKDNWIAEHESERQK